jgi:hypothetical protein
MSSLINDAHGRRNNEPPPTVGVALDITAQGFGSLGYGYGFALASDDMRTMADRYLTMEG